MKVKITKQALGDAIAVVRGAVGKAGIPAHMLITAEFGGALTLAATDYHLSLQAWTIATVAEPGTVLVPASTLAAIVAGLPDGADVDLVAAPGCRLKVSAGRSRYELNGLDPREWTDFAAREGNAWIVPADVLAHSIKCTLPFASDDDTRPNLNGVALIVADAPGGGIVWRALATDGHRVGCVQRTVDLEAPSGCWIVHRAACAELAKVLADAKSDVSISQSGNSLIFRVDRCAIYVRQIEGSFPDVSRILAIPDNARGIIVPKAGFVAAVQRVGKIAPPKDKGIVLDFVAGRLLLTAKHPEHGTAQDEIDLQGWQGGGVTLSLDPGYLIEACKVFAGENVTIEVCGDLSPVYFSSDADPGVLHALMPRRM